MTAAIVAGFLALLAGGGAGYYVRMAQSRRQTGSLENEARRALREAQAQAEAVRREGQVQARAEVLKAKEEFEATTKARRKEFEQTEERLVQREQNLDRKVAMIDKKEQTLEEKIARADQQAAELRQRKEQLDKLVAEERDKLQQVAGMTQEEARKLLLARMEKEARGEMGALIRRMQEQAKESAEREAKKIVAQAIERYAASHAGEMMTSTVPLPNEEVKGRIIGREGRNIRALEAVTGVNILIDDTPEAVVISGFDPVRREVARQSLEQLIADGRIHPARIEEVVTSVQENMQEIIRVAGEEAVFKTGAQNVNPDLLRMIGRLKFRTSYSQNVLQHSLEVANLMGVMAGEIGLDVSLAKRVGLFHDIGKALDHEVEGGHAVIGADLLKKQREDSTVVNAVAAHHEEVAAESIYAILASAADAISSSRPGARSETTDIYVKRLEKLEAIAGEFKGVKKSYAVQAGREVRVIVKPEELDDNAAIILARDISKKIEESLQYPGQIRVVVIRETRCIEYAR
ncbi:MAG: ribonuclease Y [Verrucomicrobiota bacterium]|nr:ribonuclease Y [Verrucomicrobiota bacterium]